MKLNAILRAASLVLALGLLARPAQAQPSSTPRADFWRTDGLVNAVVITNGTAYVGGDFTYVGPNTGAAGLFDTVTGSPISGFPQVDGTISAVISDGAGGWYLGGLFIPAAATNLQNLIHVNADNTLDKNFKPNPDARVRALALVGDSLLVGGEFYSIANTAARASFATLDPVTGRTNSVQLRVNGVVSAMTVVGDTVYLGGALNSVYTYANNQQVNNPRTRLAAIKPATSELLAWAPACAGGYLGVNAIAANADGSVIYVGGDFTQCGGKPRNAIAALKSSDGTANNWNPNAQLTGSTPVINALAVVGGTVYVGGDFTTIGTRNRDRLAAILASGFGTADATWQADANDFVNFITPLGNSLLVGGRFTIIGGSIDTSVSPPLQTGGTVRRGFAQIDQASAAVTGFGPQFSSLKTPSIYNPAINSSSIAVAIQGSEALIVGDFVSYGGVNRSRLAAINLASGVPTVWDPSADFLVRTLALSGSGLYVGGSFTNIGGAAHPRIARLSYSTGLADAWDAQFAQGQYVSAIAPGKTTVFVGGSFSKIGGQPRSSLAELNSQTGSATDWDPQPSGAVNALLYNQDKIYVAGAFYGISGTARQFLALLGTNVVQTSQLVTSFDPQADAQVRALSLDSGRLYVAGDFGRISGQDRKTAAALDPLTGKESLNNPLDFQVSGGQLQTRTILGVSQLAYIGGSWRSAGGENRGRVAAVNSAFGPASGWDPGADAPVSAIATGSDTIVIGGEFTRLGLRGANPNTTIDGQPVTFLAAFSSLPGVQNFKRNPAGHYTFDIADGDGLGSSLVIESSDSLAPTNWQTRDIRDILGLQDTFEDTTSGTAVNRFYRLRRTP